MKLRRSHLVWSFRLLSISLLANYVITAGYLVVRAAVPSVISATAYYGVWVAWSWYVGHRLRQGSGLRAAAGLLATMGFFVGGAVVIVVAVGGRYEVPPLLLFVHCVSALLYLCALVGTVAVAFDNRPG